MVEEALELVHMIVEAKNSIEVLISMSMVLSSSLCLSLSVSSPFFTDVLNLRMMWKKQSNKCCLGQQETSAVFQIIRQRNLSRGGFSGQLRKEEVNLYFASIGETILCKVNVGLSQMRNEKLNPKLNCYVITFLEISPDFVLPCSSCILSIFRRFRGDHIGLSG